jgi:hypothetical protein
MDAKTRDIALLSFLSLFRAGFAWSWGHFIWVRSFVLGVVAVLDIAERYWR